jgi:hypothetical protein
VRHKVVELPLVPGALSDDTDLAAKLRTVDMDKVRFRGNRAETIKGYSAFNTNGVATGTARGIHAYADLDGTPIVIAASESAVYAWKGGTRYTITPPWTDTWLGSVSHGGSASATYNGSTGSVLITWRPYFPSSGESAEAPHFLTTGDSVTFSNVVARSSSGITLAGTFSIAAVPSPTTFVVNAATGTSINIELPFTAVTALRAGLSTGTGDMASQRARVWSIDNFGENAVFCGSDGTPVFTWQGETSSSNVITNGTFGSSTGWTTEGNWSIASGVAKHTATAEEDLSYDVSGLLEAGKIYEMSFDITAWGGEVNQFRVRIDAVDIFPPIVAEVNSGADSNMVQTYTFRFLCPASPSQLIFTADADGGIAPGTDVIIDNVSIALVTTARPITEAPSKNYALFVDGNRVLNVLGSVEADGDFNASLLRWSDQDNYREWVPSTTNIAGEYPLGKGSAAICGGQVGERNLILTDDGAYTASFTSNGYAVRLIGQGCGAVGQRCLAIHNNRAFWASKNGFHAYDGAQVLAIECPIHDRYVGQLKQYQENKVFAWLNVQFGEVWFHYPHTTDGNEISRYVVFNFLEQGNPWSFGTFNRTCWVRAGVYQDPIAIDSSGNIWKHETGNVFSGSVTLPFLETGYTVGEAGDQWLGCRRYYPDFENQTGDILWTMTGKRAPQGSSQTQVIGPKTIVADQRKVDFLLASRQFKFKWASSTSTTAWRLGVVGLEMRAQKERR